MDDLFFTSESEEMIEEACVGLQNKYGAVTRADGPTVNYLGMVFDLSTAGEARVTVKGYVDDTLGGSGITGEAKTPATDGLFEVRDKELVSEEKRANFHRIVAKLLNLAKRTRPD